LLDWLVAEMNLPTVSDAAGVGCRVGSTMLKCSCGFWCMNVMRCSRPTCDFAAGAPTVSAANMAANAVTNIAPLFKAPKRIQPPLE